MNAQKIQKREPLLSSRKKQTLEALLSSTNAPKIVTCYKGKHVSYTNDHLLENGYMIAKCD